MIEKLFPEDVRNPRLGPVEFLSYLLPFSGDSLGARSELPGAAANMTRDAGICVQTSGVHHASVK